MIPHNNEKDSLHLLCSYIYEGEICRIIDLDSYPKVVIRMPDGKSKTVDASTIYHISLTDAILDQLSDKKEETADATPEWTFSDRIPAHVTKSTADYRYQYSNPLSEERHLQPFPVQTLDSLQHIRHLVSHNRKYDICKAAQ